MGDERSVERSTRPGHHRAVNVHGHVHAQCFKPIVLVTEEVNSNKCHSSLTTSSRPTLACDSSIAANSDQRNIRPAEASRNISTASAAAKKDKHSTKVKQEDSENVSVPALRTKRKHRQNVNQLYYVVQCGTRQAVGIIDHAYLRGRKVIPMVKEANSPEHCHTNNPLYPVAHQIQDSDRLPTQADHHQTPQAIVAVDHQCISSSQSCHIWAHELVVNDFKQSDHEHTTQKSERHSLSNVNQTPIKVKLEETNDKLSVVDVSTNSGTQHIPLILPKPCNTGCKPPKNDSAAHKHETLEVQTGRVLNSKCIVSASSPLVMRRLKTASELMLEGGNNKPTTQKLPPSTASNTLKTADVLQSPLQLNKPESCVLAATSTIIEDVKRISAMEQLELMTDNSNVGLPHLNQSDSEGLTNLQVFSPLYSQPVRPPICVKHQTVHMFTEKEPRPEKESPLEKKPPPDKKLSQEKELSPEHGSVMISNIRLTDSPLSCRGGVTVCRALCMQGLSANASADSVNEPCDRLG